MRYIGSKARHAKEMLPIILKDRKEGQWYVEPFVGGCNMIDKVSGNRIGADVHEYLIAMWQAVSVGWLPPYKFTEEDYKQVKLALDNKNPMTAYAGFSLSYAGKWFGGWCRGVTSKGVSRDYVDESYRASIRDFPKLVGVQFHCCTYDALEFPSNSIIYCDPPYKGTTKYKDDFNHDKFYAWCREKRKEGHTVFVSEYWMPDDFTCVWQKEVNSSLTKDTGSKKAVEKLFTLY
jgi:DNA adenine methylase